MNMLNTEKLMKFLKNGLVLRVLVLFLLVLVISIINPSFLKAFNLSTVLMDVGLLLITSLGTTFVLLIGSIDLSLGSALSCGAIMMAVLMPRIGIWAYPAALAFGMLLGFINGLIVTKLRIPSFISTLGTMNVLSSLALLLCNSTPIIIDTDLKWMMSWVKIHVSFVPLVFILAIALMIVLWAVQTKTKFGKHVMAIGVNEQAARMAGVKINRIKVGVFALAGLCYAVAAIVLTSNMRSGIPNVGSSYTMMSIAAAALGGTSLSGGKGKVYYALVGAALSVAITNGMILVGVSAYWMQIIYGVIIVLALITTVNRKDTGLAVK